MPLLLHIEETEEERKEIDDNHMQLLLKLSKTYCIKT